MNYAVEVKAGKNQGKTAMQMLQDGKVSYIYYLKGDTYGGCAGKIVTIPIYLMGRVTFNQEAFMLDSTAYNHIVDSEEYIETARKSIYYGFHYFSTAIQDMELSGQGAKTYNKDCIPVRKAKMPEEKLEKFAMLNKELQIERLPEVATAMLNHSRVDGTNRFFAPNSFEGKLYELIANKNKTNSSRPFEYSYDALIAEAAMHYGCILVTDDKELRDTVNSVFKNKAISTETLISNIEKSISQNEK